MSEVPGHLRITVGGQARERAVARRLTLGSLASCDIEIPGAAPVHGFFAPEAGRLALFCLSPVMYNGVELTDQVILAHGDRLELLGVVVEWLAPAPLITAVPIAAEPATPIVVDVREREAEVRAPAIKVRPRLEKSEQKTNDLPPLGAPEVTPLTPELAPIERPSAPPRPPGRGRVDGPSTPGPAAADPDEVVQLVSRPPQRSGGMPGGGAFLIAVIAVSLAGGAYAWSQRRIQIARQELEELRGEVGRGAFAGGLRRAQERIADPRAARFREEYGEIRDRCRLELAAAELAVDPIAVETAARAYLDSHGHRSLPDSEVADRVLAAQVKRLSELRALLGEAQDATAAAAIAAPFEALARRVEAGWSGQRMGDRVTLRKAVAETSVALTEARRRLDAGLVVERLEARLAEQLGRRDPIAARALINAAVVEAGGLPEASIKSLGARVDELERDILQFQPDRADPSARPRQADRVAWRRPLTRRALKALPPILDPEHLVYFAGAGALVALDPRSGAARWALASDAESAPEVVRLEARDVLVAWTREGLIQIVLPDGRVAARLELEAALAEAPVIVGTRLVAPGLDGILRVVELETGAIAGRAILSGRLAAPLSVDAATRRVVAALAHDTVAILAVDSKTSPELIHLAPGTCARFAVAPLLVRDHLLLFENLPGAPGGERRTRMTILQRSPDGAPLAKGEFQLEGWVLRAPAFCNGRLLVTTDRACVYPLTVNTVDLSEGVQAGFDPKEPPRRLEGEGLVVAQLEGPSVVYFGGRRIERKVLNERTRWWATESVLRPLDSPLPELGIVHRPFQILEDRLIVTSLDARGEGLCVTALGVRENRRSWQVRAGLPARRPFLEHATGLFYIERDGALIPVPSLRADEGGRFTVCAPLLPERGGEDGRPAIFELGGRLAVARSIQGGLELVGVLEPGAIDIAEANQEVSVETTSRASVRWQRNLPAPINTDIVAGDGALVFATADGLCYALDARSGKDLAAPFASGARHLAGPILVAPGLVVYGVEDGTVRLVERSSGARATLSELARRRISPGPVARLEGRADALWVSDEGGRVVLLRIADAGLIERSAYDLGEPILALAIEPDGPRALVATATRFILLDPAIPTPQVLALLNPAHPPVGAAFRAEGRVAIALADGALSWYRLKDAACLETIALGQRITAALFQPREVVAVTPEGVLALTKEP